MKYFIKNFYFINKLTFKKYSILRIIQILNLLKLNLRGNILDVGAKRSPNNISNVLKNNIRYLDKFSNNVDDIKIDLEEGINLDLYKDKKFK